MGLENMKAGLVKDLLDVTYYHVLVQEGVQTSITDGATANILEDGRVQIMAPSDHPNILGGGFIIGDGSAMGSSGYATISCPIDQTGLPADNSARIPAGWMGASNAGADEEFLTVWVIAAK